MKSTFVLIVLCAFFCLSATAQAAYSPSMQVDQFQKVSPKKESLPIKTTVKKETQLPVVQENTKQKKALVNYFLPLNQAYNASINWNTKSEKLRNSSIATPTKAVNKSN